MRHKLLLLLIAVIATIDCAFAQERTITGKVTDMESGEPLPGVTVVVQGTSTGTATDLDGNYKLSVGEDAKVLVFSFVGYVSEEVPIGNRSNIGIELAPDVQSLSEVVVIGYGEKSRKLLTESIGTVSAEQLQKVPVASADAAIKGRLSGVQVSSVDGTPGAPVSIRIRGVGTVGNTQPLFVIDGVPVGSGEDARTNPLTTINPNDIESISVLKDASAAAVYGVRAANGVVLITTKRGKTGKPTVTLDSYYGVQNFPKLYEWNNTDQYLQLSREAVDARNTQLGLSPGDDDYQVLHPDLLPGSPYLNRNTDWQSPLLNENAPIQNHNLSVSGGNENANFYVSAGYFKQEATVRKWELERYSFRANGDYKIGNRLRIGNTLSLSHQHVYRGLNGGGDGFLFGTANLPPFYEIYDTDNSVPNNRYGFDGNAGVGGMNIANQFALNELIENNDRTTRLLGGLYVEIDILKSLTFKSAASIDFSTGQNTSWTPGVTIAEVGYDRPLNNYNDGRNLGNTQVFTNTLNYHNSLGDHGINALAGIEYQRLRNTGIAVGGKDFVSADPLFYVDPRNQRDQYSVGASNGNDAFVGYIGRISYDYKQKYLLTATVRWDGTAHFAPENRWGTFPSVSAAWRVSEEPFFSGVPVISDLKVRASWGQLGNANLGHFSHYGRISTTPDYALGRDGGWNYQAPTQTNLVNNKVGWETVESTDIGIDMSLFNNKLTFLATYYNRNTKDFLYELPAPLTGGFGNIWGPGSNIGYPVNAGNVLNRGLEFELGYISSIGSDFNFNVSGNLTTVHNELTALAPGYSEYSSGDYRTAIGYPIGYFYGYRTAGLYQNATEAQGALPDELAGEADFNRPRPGDVIFLDVNGLAPEGAPQGQLFSGEPDGKISPADRTYLGKTIPDFFYGLNLDADFKGFDISVLFQGVSGVQVYNEFRRNNEGLGAAGRNELVSTQDRWTGEGTSNSMPRAIEGDPYQNNRFSDRFVENAGYFRLKNVQLGYSIPSSLLGKTNAISNVRFYVAGTNLITITEYTGLDPEVTTYGRNTAQTEAGTDRGNMPQPITLTGGIQVQF